MMDPKKYFEAYATNLEVEIPPELKERLEKEMECSDKIAKSFREICEYMWSHNLCELRLENEKVKFMFTMEVTDDSKY